MEVDRYCNECLGYYSYDVDEVDNFKKMSMVWFRRYRGGIEIFYIIVWIRDKKWIVNYTKRIKIMISKVILKNFKGFQNIELECNKENNILIGENGSGKTTILYAIGLVLSGSHAQIEKNGLASLFNSTAISKFFKFKGYKTFTWIICGDLFWWFLWRNKE